MDIKDLQNRAQDAFNQAKEGIEGVKDDVGGQYREEKGRIQGQEEAQSQQQDDSGRLGGDVERSRDTHRDGVDEKLQEDEDPQYWR
jgi:hypothetical protein